MGLTHVRMLAVLLRADTLERMRLPTLHRTALQLRRGWRDILDRVEHEGEHAAIRKRKTSTMEVVSVDVHDTYRRALDDTHTPEPLKTREDRSRALPETEAPWVVGPAEVVLRSLAAVQELVRDGVRITVTRNEVPSVVLIPPEWARRAREALADDVG